MPKETPTTPSPKDLVRELAGTREYMAVLARTPDLDTESGISRMSVAMGATAHTLVRRYQQEHGTTYLDDKHQMLNIMAHVPHVVESNAVMNAPKGIYDRTDIRRAKRALISLNHAIRGVIDSSPSMTRAELISKISEATATMVPVEQTGEFQRTLRTHINGMQQEIFTEQALWSIPDVEVDDEVSVEDELNGIDIRFHYKGQPYTMDVKSSPESAQAAAETQWSDEDTILFWTGIRSHEIGEAFRANKEQEATIRERLMAVFETNEADTKKLA